MVRCIGLRRAFLEPISVTPSAGTVMLRVMAAIVERFSPGGSLLKQLQLVGVAAYALFFALLTAYGQPGMGVGHGFYIPIVLIGLATGPIVGAFAGLAATTLYIVALALRDAAGWPDIVSTRMTLHAAAYVSIGLLVGFFAGRARRVFGDSLRVIEALMAHSRRDLESGALESEEFARVLAKRARGGRSFALLVVELETDARARTRGKSDAELVRAAMECMVAQGLTTDVGCTGPRQLSVIVPSASDTAARSAAASLERALIAAGCRGTVGWVLGPAAGDDALTLFGAALERLYSCRVLRGDWSPTPASAGLLEA